MINYLFRIIAVILRYFFRFKKRDARLLEEYYFGDSLTESYCKVKKSQIQNESMWHGSEGEMSSDMHQNPKRTEFRAASTQNGVHFYKFLCDRNGDHQPKNTKYKKNRRTMPFPGKVALQFGVPCSYVC